MFFFESSLLMIIIGNAVHVHSKLTRIPFVFCKLTISCMGTLPATKKKKKKKLKINDW